MTRSTAARKKTGTLYGAAKLGCNMAFPFREAASSTAVDAMGSARETHTYTSLLKEELHIMSLDWTAR